MTMRSNDILREQNWHPFRVTSGKPDAIRGLTAPVGVTDRLRLVAFAELQARDMFRYGAARFAGQVPEEWRSTWMRFAEVEDRHAQLLLNRMAELNAEPGARTVSDKLTRLCLKAEEPILFLFLLASAEERGMEAGVILGEQMKKVDAESAGIFALIAEEEVEHVQMARSVLAAYEPAALQERARAVNALL